MHPCGEPVQLYSVSDKAPLVRTFCDLSVKKSITHKIRPWSYLNRVSKFLPRMTGYMVLKPEEKSTNRSLAKAPLLSR